MCAEYIPIMSISVIINRYVCVPPASAKKQPFFETFQMQLSSAQWWKGRPGKSLRKPELISILNFLKPISKPSWSVWIRAVLEKERERGWLSINQIIDQCGLCDPWQLLWSIVQTQQGEPQQPIFKSDVHRVQVTGQSPIIQQLGWKPTLVK